MIKIENVEVVGWEHAIRGMRNPMNSWERSDSELTANCTKCVSDSGVCAPFKRECYKFVDYKIGANDHKLMTQLANGGPVHGKFRRMITVYLDIIARFTGGKSLIHTKLVQLLIVVARCTKFMRGSLV